MAKLLTVNCAEGSQLLHERSMHGNNEICALSGHYQEIRTANGCVINRIVPEWLQLKRYLKRNWQLKFSENKGDQISAWKIIFKTEGSTSSGVSEYEHFLLYIL